MKNKAAPQADVKGRHGLIAAALPLAIVGMLAVVLGGTAAAAPPIGKDGQVHACYQVKGKEKGSMRVVAGKYCRRGERKLAWSIAGPQGPAGPQGAPGSSGGQGSVGQPGPEGAGGAGLAGATVTTLEDKITSLTSDVSDLKATLEGVTNQQLKGALATVDGITNLELTEALTDLPALQTQVADLTANLGDVEDSVGEVCAQAESLTSQVNVVGDALGEIQLIGGIISLLLPEVDPLDDFVCGA